jgi:hypothetical protein
MANVTSISELPVTANGQSDANVVLQTVEKTTMNNVNTNYNPTPPSAPPQSIQQGIQPSAAPQPGAPQNSIVGTALGETNNSASMATTMPPLDQNAMSKVISGIQQASANGLTQLPSRDIPQNTINISQDEQIQPNYMPRAQGDYISEQETNATLQEQNMRMQNKQNSADVMYEELQTPVLIAFLAFLFQLPVVDKTLLGFLPSLFAKDGHPIFGGYVLKSIIFAVMYYVLAKLMAHFSAV